MWLNSMCTLLLTASAVSATCPELLEPFSSEKAYSAKLAPSNKQGETYEWNLNFCKDASSCGSGYSGCQTTTSGMKTVYKFATTGGDQVTLEGGDLVVSTESVPDGYLNRKAKITIKCDKQYPDGKIVDVYEDDTSTYYESLFIITLKHAKACPDYGQAGLSFGSIMLIVMVSVFFAYWVGGFIFFKFVKKNEGLEVIPHVAFWADLPSLVADGYRFIRSKTWRKDSGSAEYDTI